MFFFQQQKTMNLLHTKNNSFDTIFFGPYKRMTNHTNIELSRFSNQKLEWGGLANLEFCDITDSFSQTPSLLIASVT